MTTVESNSYFVANACDITKEEVMSAIKEALENANTSKGDIAQVTLEDELGKDTLAKWGLAGIDISSGGGALLLDSVLQKLSTMEQVSAQFLASVYKAVKQINQMLAGG